MEFLPDVEITKEGQLARALSELARQQRAMQIRCKSLEDSVMDLTKRLKEHKRDREFEKRRRRRTGSGL